MTEPNHFIESNHFIDFCHKHGQGIPHPPHHVGRCDHQLNTWCYGVPEPGSVEAAIEGLQPGQRVRVVWEGVVTQPSRFLADAHKRAPVCVGSNEDICVLRYTGQSPGWPDATARKVAGQHNSGVVSVEVLPDPALDE